MYFILILRRRLVAIKEAPLFFSCFLYLEVVGFFLRTSITVPWMRVYAYLRLLKAGISGGLPSLSLLVFPPGFPLFYVRESPVWTRFGTFLAIYWSCKLAQVGEGKPTSFVGLGFP